MSKKRFRYLDFDVTKTEQQDVVLRLCKNNKFSYGDVWLHLRKTTPPGLPDALTESIQSRMENFSRSMNEWDMKGIIAVDGSVTENNPEGTSKVVGFMLYQIHRETKTELEQLFIVVDKDYRRRGHGKNMMKACESLHLYPNKANDNDLVKFFTAKVEEDNHEAIEFYKNISFTSHPSPSPDHPYKIMFKGGPNCKKENPTDTPTHVSTEMCIMKEEQTPVS
jgi:ribosomal protein S18 acetylase RimI-like enzyme